MYINVYWNWFLSVWSSPCLNVCGYICVFVFVGRLATLVAVDARSRVTFLWQGLKPYPSFLPLPWASPVGVPEVLGDPQRHAHPNNGGNYCLTKTYCSSALFLHKQDPSLIIELMGVFRVRTGKKLLGIDSGQRKKIETIL